MTDDELTGRARKLLIECGAYFEGHTFGDRLAALREANQIVAAALADIRRETLKEVIRWCDIAPIISEKGLAKNPGAVEWWNKGTLDARRDIAASIRALNKPDGEG